MMMHFRARKQTYGLVMAMLLLVWQIGQPLQAANATWNGTTNGIWATSTNWSATPLPGTGDTATFNNAGNGITLIDLGTGVTVNTILFDTALVAAYTIGAGAVGSQTLTLNNGGAITMNSAVAANQLFNAALVLGTDATAQSYTITNSSTTNSLTFAGNITGGTGGTAGAKALTISAAAGGNVIINGIISNGGASSLPITKTGAGTLELNGNNTYTGITTISAGIVKLGNAAGLGASGNLNHTIVAAGATLDLNGLSIAEQFGQSSTTFSDGFGGVTAILTNSSATAAAVTGEINFDGAGAFTVNGTGGDITLSRVRRANGTGDVTITKDGTNTLVLVGTADNSALSVTVNAGVVQLNKGGTGVRALGGATTTIGASGTLRLTTGQANGDQIFANVNVVNNGIFDLQGQNESFNAMTGTGTVTNGATNDASVLTLGENNGGFTWGGVIQDGAGTSTLSLTKMGTGVMTITGTNTYSGATRIDGTGGGITLDFATAAGATNLISSFSALTMNNTSAVRTQTLTLTGKASTINSQTFNGTAITGTGTRHQIVATSGTSGTMNLSLGALTLTNSSFVDFVLPATGSITTTNANAILGPRFTVNNGGNYAQILDNAIVAYNGSLVYASGTNISALVGYDAADDLLVNNTSNGNVVQAAGTTDLNTVQFTDTANRTLTLGTGNTLRLGATGGILRGNTAGSVVIGESGNAGTLTTGTTAGQDLILTNGNAAGTLTVNSVIANNAGGAVDVFVNGSGTATTILAGANTTTGAITVQTGTLRATNNASLGTAAGGVTIFDGAALELSGGITIGDEALSLSGTGVGSNGALRNLSGTNTYGGQVTATIAPEIQAETSTTLIFDRPGTANAITSANISMTFDTVGTGVITFNDAIAITSTSNPTVTKAGTGTLNLNVANSWGGTGAFTISAGTVRISNGAALGGATGGTSISANAALELTGGITTDEPITLNNTTGISAAGAIRNISGNNTISGTVVIDNGSGRINSDSGTLTLSGSTALRGEPSDATARTLTLGGAGNITVSGIIANGAGATNTAPLNIVKDGAGILTLSGNTNTTAGTTMVNGGVLRLDYGTNNNTKLADAAALTLGGGTIELVGGSHTEIVVSTALTAGTVSTISRSSGTSVLALNAITPGAGAALHLTADGIATTDNLNTNGILGGWATIANGGVTTFAMNQSNAFDGAIVAVTPTADVTRLSSGTKVIADGSTIHVRIVEGTTGPAANITLAAATTTINTLNQSTSGGTGAAIIDPAGQILALNAILAGSGAGSLTIGNGTNNGTLRSAGTSLEINNSATITVNSIVANGTGGASSLTKYGSGLLTLAGNNTYTGATQVGGGILRLTGTNGATAVTVNTGGTLQIGAATALTSTNNITLAGTGIFDLAGISVTVGTFTSTSTNIITNSSTAVTASTATAGGTPSGTGVYVEALTISGAAPTLAALIQDGATRKTQLVVNNANANNQITTNTANTFSGGLVLANNATGTRLSIGTITGTPWGTGPIIVGQAATDKAGIIFGTANQTLVNDIVMNTALGTDRVGIRLDTTGNVLSGTLTANLAPITFSTNGTGAASLTGKVTGTFGLVLSAATSGASLTITLNNTGAANDYAGDTVIGETATAGRIRTLTLGAANQIANGTGKGNVVINTNGTGIGMLNLAGFNETINGLSGNGTVDMLTGTAATLTVGDNDATGAANTFSGTIKNTAGVLSLAKIGNGTLTLSSANTFSGSLAVNAGTVAFSAFDQLGNNAVTNTFSANGGTLSYTGAGAASLGANQVLTAGAGGVTLNASVSTGSITYAGGITSSSSANLTKTGLGSVIVSGNTNLSGGGVTVSTGTLQAGFSPSGLGSINVASGATLNLYNGTANTTSIASLTLASGSSLGFDLGAPGTNDTLNVSTTLAISSGVLLNFNNLGGLAGGTYDLINTSSGTFTLADFSVALVPSGFSYGLSTVNSSQTLRLTTSPLNLVYWRGDVDGSWSTNTVGDTNWASNAAGTTDLGALPIGTDTLVFSTTNATGPTITTSLDGNFTADSLQFTANPSGVTAVTINQGSSGTLTITPYSSNNGISVAANAGAVTLNAPVVTGAAQTWEVNGTGANGSSLTLGGAVTFTNEVIKTGAGALTLSGSNSGAAGLTLAAGLLNLNHANALGTGALTISGGTLDNTSGSALTLSNNAQSWDGSFSFTGTHNLNLGAGAVSLGTAAGTSRTVTTTAGTLTVGGIISNGTTANQLVKAGNGSMTLNGANAHTGGVLHNAGTLNLGNAAALGTGTLTFGTAGVVFDNSTGSALTLSTNNAQTWNADFTFTGTNNLNLGTGAVSFGTAAGTSRTVTTTAGTLTVGGIISNGTTANQLVKAGNGSMTLNGANAHTGGVLHNAGTLNLGNAAALGTGTLTFGTAGVVFDNSTGSALTLSTNNAQAYNADFTFTGTQDLNMGTGNVTLGATRIVTVNAGVLTIGGIVDDGASTFTLTKAGTGTLYLKGVNTFGSNSAVTISGGGVLRIDAESGLGTNTNDVTFGTGGGTLQVTNGFTANAGKVISVQAGPGTIQVDSGTLVIGSAIVGTAAATANGGGLIKTGAGTLALTVSSSSYDAQGVAAAGSGATGLVGFRVDAGTLLLQGTSNSVVGDVTPNSMTIQLNGGNLTIQTDTASIARANLWVSADATLTSDRAAAGGSLTQSIGTGTGAQLTIGNTGAGAAVTLNVTGGSNYTSGTASVTFGATTLNRSAVFNITDPSGAITLLTLGAITGGANSITLQGNGDFAQSGVFAGTGASLVLDSGYTGTATLNQANTFTGGVTIRSGTVVQSTAPAGLGTGTLTLGHTSGSDNATLTATGTGFTATNAITVAAGSSGTATIGGNNGSAFVYSGAVTLNKELRINTTGTGNFTLGSVGGITGTGSLANVSTGTGQVTLSGLIGSGVTGITQNSSTSKLVLSNGQNAFAGGVVVIKAGTLQGSQNTAGQTTALGSGSVQLGDTGGSSSATLELQGTQATFANPVFLGTTSGALTILSANGATPVNLTGGITGSNSVIFNTGTGTAAMNITTAAVNNAGSLTNATVTGTGTLHISAPIGTSVTGIIQNSATSATTLSNASIAFTGVINVQAGTLNITGGSTTAPTLNALTIAGGGTLNLLNTVGQHFNLGSGIINLGAGGTSTLSLELGSTSNYDRFSSSVAAITANNVVLNLTGITGFGAGTYDLLAASDGLGGAAYSIGTLGGAVAGHTFSLNTSATLVQLVATASSGDFYWDGAVNTSWTGISGLNTNWTSDPTGNTNTNGTPGAASSVIFSSDDITGTALATTLDAAFTIKDLTFNNQVGAGPLATLSIAAGTGGTLTIAPAATTAGINVQNGAPVVTISAPVILGASQTWTNASAGLLTVSGGVTGAFDLSLAATNTGGITLSTGSVNNGGTVTNSGSGNGTVTISSVIGTNVTGVTQDSATSALQLGGAANLWSTGLTIKAGNVIGGNNAATFGASGNVITLGHTSGSANTQLTPFNSFTYLQPITVKGGNTGIATLMLGTTTGSVVWAGAITLDTHDLTIAKQGTTGATQVTGGITGIGNLTIDNDGTTGTIALATTAIDHVGSITNIGSATGTTTISANIGGNVTDVIQNSATSGLTLSGTNTFTGGVDLMAGTLTLGSATALGATGGALTITGGTTLNSSVANLVNANNNAVVMNGDFTFTGTQSLDLGTGAVSLGSTVGARQITVAASTLTLGGVISNGTATALTKAGTGTLTLTGANAYTGATTISAGTLQIGAGGTSGSLSPSGGIVNNATLTFNRTNTLTQSTGLGNISGTGAVIQLGTGTTILNGTNTYTGASSVRAGTLSITGSTLGAGMTVGTNNAGSRGTLLISGSGSLSVTGSVVAGTNATAAGAIYQSGGTVAAAAGDGNNAGFALGTVAGGYGYYKMSGGTLTVNRFSVGGNSAAGATGVFEMTGGAIDNNAWGLVVQSGAGNSGLMDISGGTYNAAGSNGFAANHGSSGYAIINVRGTGTFDRSLSSGTISLMQGNTNSLTNTGILNLITGGTVRTGSGGIVSGAGTGSSGNLILANFNGGTIITNAGSSNLINILSTGANTSTSGAYLYSGGLTVDTNGLNSTINGVLRATSGEGVASIAVATEGSGYIGAPMIKITGGSGVGATAIANMVDDGLGQGTFKIGSITITNPGTGYLNTDVLTLTFGDNTSVYSTQATFGAVTFNGGNTSGGLTKTGLGTLTLSAANTYTGGTTINAGTLALGVANALAEAGNVTINGGTFDVATFNDTVATVSLQSGSITGSTGVLTSTANYDLRSGTVNFSGAGGLAGAVNVNKSTAGTVTLSGNGFNTGFANSVNITGGTLAFSTSTQLGSAAATNTLTLNGGGATLSYTGAGSVDLGANRTVSIGAGGGTIAATQTTGVLTTGVVSGTGNLTKAGAGTVILPGSTSLNGGAGDVIVNAGTLQAGFGTNGVDSLTVAAGANLSLQNGATQVLAGLTTLSLGNGARLGFELGAPGSSDQLNLAASSTLMLGTGITLDFINLGGLGVGTYNLIHDPDAGLTLGNFTLGSAPSGFNYSLGLTGGTQLYLNVQQFQNAYWTGDQSNSWSTLTGGTNSNFSTDSPADNDLGALPGSSDTVIFSAASGLIAGPAGPTITTTLDGTPTINNLVFSSTPSGVTAVTIADGGAGTDKLTIAPSSSVAGITIDANGGNNVISAMLEAGTNQTWSIDGTGASSLTLSGQVTFTGSVNKTGAGALTLSGANTGTGAFTLTGGTLNLNHNDALGTSTGSFTIGAGTTINNSSAGTVTLSNTRAQAWNGSFTFTGTQALNLGTGAVTLVNNATITTTASTLTVGGTIGDSGQNKSLTKDGGGTLVVTGGLTLGGNLAVTAGTGTFNGGSNTIGGSVTASGTALTMNGASTIGSGVSVTAGTATLNGNNTITGSVTVTGGTLNLGGANTISGGTSLTTGTLNLANAGALGSTTFIINSGTLNNTSGADLELTTDNSQAWNGSFTFTGTHSLNLGDGAVMLGATPTVTTSANTLTVNGVIDDGVNTFGITKAGGGTLSLGGANTYEGATTLNGGTLKFTVDQNLSAATNTLIFGSSGSSTVSNLDLSTASATFEGAMTVQTNTTSDNTISIGAGETLRVNRAVTVGFNSAAVTTTDLIITGGTFTIGDATTPTNANVQIGNNGTDGFSNKATLDMSGLTTFYANLGTGTFRVGDPTNGTGAAGTGGGGSTLILADTSTIRAATITSDSPASAVTQAIKLGSVANVLHADTITIGGAGNRATGTLDFNEATGTLQVRNLAGTGRAAMNVQNGNSATAANIAGTVDLNGHHADLLLSTLAVGGRSAGTGTGTGTFSFDTGTLDATTLNIAARSGSSLTTGSVTGTVTLGANSTIGTVTMATNSSSVSTTGDAVATLNISGGTNTITTLTMGVNTSAAATGNGSNTDAILNITGGATTVSTTFTMGAQNSAANAATNNNSAISSLNISAGSLTLAGATNLTMGQATLDDNNLATATISITGTGSLTVGGNIQYTNAALGVENNTVTLNGGTLDMTGGNIGGAGGTGAGAGIITFNAQSGTLQNVNQINGGAGLTKTAGAGSNTLILEGTNTYTGGTTISSGILQVGGGTLGTGSGTGTLGSGDVTNNATLTINRSTSYTVSNNITGTGAVIQAGGGTTILSGTNTYTGKTTISAGKLSIDSESRLGANPGAPAADQLTLDGGTLQTTATLAIDDANRGITVGTNGGTFEVASSTTTSVNSVITGGGAITKEGAGTLIFTAVNTNTGTTTVNAGVLGGTGAVGGSVILNSGTLAPGTTAEGLFTIGGNLTVNSGGTLLMQIGGTNVPNAESVVRGFETNLTGISAGIIDGWNATPITLHDVVSVNGAAAPVINGTFKIAPTFLNSYTPVFGDVFDFLDWTAVGSITGTTAFDFTGIVLGGELTFNTQLFSSHGIIVVVPEPSRALFLMLGLLGLMLRRRRR